MINNLFKGFLIFLIVTLVFYLSPAPLALANPAGASVSSGSATIASSGNTETINQKSSNAVIDWNSFNIGGSETTKFVQPNSSSLTVNRVHDMNPSQIFGSLTANGNLVLINPNGVFFGQGSKVDVNGLLATTSNVANSNAMSGGTMHFTPGGNASASVVNAGTITAADAGLVGLVAPNVQNSGVITAKLGKVQLASGDSFDLDFYGDNLLNIGVSGQVQQQIVQNLGSIEADGGIVKLTAAAGRSMVNSLIDVEGQIKTPAFKAQNGVIEIYAEGSNAVPGNAAADKGTKQGSSTVTVSGYLDASGYGAGQTGGSISILGDNIGILSGAMIDASGDQGGGNIKIGGDFHGQGTTPTALNTTVEHGAIIQANGGIGLPPGALAQGGNGGNVAIWSDNYTDFVGSILAKGGPNGGSGGYVETSGRKLLSLTDDNGNTGTVDASAPHGIAGTWLLDPEDVTISNGADSDETGNPSFVPGGNQATSVISTSDITTALNAGTNVSITTGGDSQTGPNGGSITVSSPISATGAGTALSQTGSLTLSSFKDIIVNAAITLGGGTNTSSQTVTGGNLTLDSANSGNSIGAIFVGANVTTNGGNITMGGNEANPANIAAGTGFAVGDANVKSLAGSGGYGAGVFNNGLINAGGGNIIINGIGYSSGNYNVGVSLGSVQTSGNGNLTVTGKGGASNGNFDWGIMTQYNTVSLASGTITLSGTGGGVAGDSVVDVGVYIIHGSLSTTSGNINITGNGGVANGPGVQISGGQQIYANNGSITITGTGGGTGNNNGIYLSTWLNIYTTGTGNITFYGIAGNSGTGISADGAGPNIIGNASDNGNITFNTDSISFANTTVQSLQTVTFAPYTSGTPIGVAGGSGTLQITSGTLGATSAGSITIGAANDTGAMTVDANAWTAPVKLLSGSGPITIAGAQTMGANNFTLQSDATPTFSSTVTTTGNVTLEPTSAGTTIGVAGGAGGLQIASGILSDITAGSLTIGNSSDSGAIKVAANAWTAPVTFLNGSGKIEFSGSQNMGANSLTAVSSTGNIQLDAGAGITSTSASANAITLSTGQSFINNSGSYSPLSAANSNWLVYSVAPASDISGASLMNPATTIYAEAYPNTTGVSGNSWFYSSSAPQGPGVRSHSGSLSPSPPAVTPPVVVAPTIAPVPVVVTQVPTPSAIPATVEQVVTNTPSIWNSDNVVNSPNNGGISFVNQPSFAASAVAFDVPASSGSLVRSATPSDSEAVEPSSPMSGDNGSASPAVSNNGASQPNGYGDGSSNQKKKEDEKKAKAREQSRLRDLRERFSRAARWGQLRFGDAEGPSLQPAS